METRQISPTDLYKKISAGETVNLIDVRSPKEFEAVHVAVARNVPVDVLNPMEVMNSLAAKDAPVYITCQAGTRAKMALDKFVAAGYTNVALLDGSMQGWQSAGLPVVRGDKGKCIRVDMQVRIIVGTLIVIFSILGATLNSNFSWVAAALGCGLIYAGITDDCPLALLVAKLPWNRGSNVCCTLKQ